MNKRKKRSAVHYGMQLVTLCISTSLVLILLGVIVFSVQTADNLSSYVKENITVTMLLGEDMTNAEATQLCGKLKKKHFISKVNYISREQALKEQTEAMGSDPSEFLGVNPFVASIELNLKSDYANSDSLKWISESLTSNSKVTEVTYQHDLMDSVNRNLRKVSMVLLVLAVLLTFVSFSLIRNTVSLSIYSKRFSIHTMKLVGASWNFIRGPFLARAAFAGILAAVIADSVLAACVYMLYSYENEIMVVVTPQVLVITGVSVVLFGLVITTVCSCLSVNKFLRMKAGDLYKI